MLVYTKKDVFMSKQLRKWLAHDTFLSRNKFGKMKQHHVKLLPPPPQLKW